MRNIILGISAVCLIFALGACGGSSAKKAETTIVPAAPWEEIAVETVETVVPATEECPEYTILDKTQYNLSKFAQVDGYYILFDGKSFNGWRGYGRDDVPGKWTIDEDGTMKISGGGAGEAHSEDGGDLIFGHKFKNFELSIDWKVSKGANSGIFYLAQEIKDEPIWISSPESQILDNENHIDASLGVDGNRKSSSLYDMIPAKPQNANPFDEWNNTTIIVFKGTVVHKQNGENVLEYHLWTPKWTEMLKNSKFKPGGDFPKAFSLLNNCGGENHEGYIGIQDHGDDVWFRNIKVKILD